MNILKRWTLAGIGILAWILSLTWSSTVYADYEYIDITNPFLRKLPLAVPVFKSISRSPAEIDIARKGAGLMAETLDFTGYFKILDQEAYLSDPQNAGIIGPRIKFKNWTVIGAELLITGGVLLNDDVVEMELRLFDTFKEQLLVGKRYKGRLEDQRRIIRRFCSEVIYHLTGNRGVFDSKIAFVSNGSGHKEIYLCEFDGYNPKAFTHHNSISLFPAWSYDGNWIAYTSYAKGTPDLYIKHIRQKRGYIVDKPGISISPAWLPDRLALAATLSFAGDQEIYLLTAKGKITKRLTRSWGSDVSPTFSPDGDKMAFVSSRSGAPQIYFKHLDSDQAERLTFEGRYNTQPDWSPRGNNIVYSGMVDGHIQIFLINTDTRRLVQLTHGEGNNESPSWSPDGSLIVFSSTREGPSRIYVMTASGTDQRRLLALPGEQTNPEWSPRIVNK